MRFAKHWRGLVPAILANCAVAIVALSAPIIVTVGSVTPAYAQVSAEFQAALEPYGSWQPHPRFGEVWVPYDLPPGWRPYTYGRWVYTDDWGWYWVSDAQEADWGWVAFHYGRWAHDRRLGWFWIPGDEWGPAWVDWRRGDDYVGWAPLPPDEIVYEYDNDPAYWIFVQPRYLVAPRLRTYVLPPERTIVVINRTVIVNRTMRIEQAQNRTRIAVNPGIAPGIVAAAARQPVQTFRVQPRVVAGTQGVAGAVQVRPQDLNRGGQRGQRGQPRPGGPSPVQATLQPTQTVVQPVTQVPKAQPLGKDEHGRLGPTPPRAAQGATIAPAPAPKPPGAPQQNGSPQRLNVPTPPAGTTVQPPPSPPTTTAPTTTAPTTTPPPPRTTTPPTTTAPTQQLERREERREQGPPGGPPPQPNIVRPTPPQAPPPPPPPPPQQRQVQPPPPQEQRRVQPPPPPPPPPPQQRQVQPPPPPPPPQQRQVQPPPPPAAHPPPPPPPAARAPGPPPPPPGPPPKKPPPKPGEPPDAPK